MVDGELKERVEAVKSLTLLYKPERTVYLVVTCTSLVILLAAAVMMLYRGQAGPTELGLMFGSSGMLTYTAGQLLRMWDRAMSVIAPTSGGTSE